MGSGPSIEIRRDPDPNSDPNRPDSVSISGSKNCKYNDGGKLEQCRLNIDQSISTSSITLSRATAAGNFSDDTKLQLTPSLPFRMYANGVPARITKMTLYHPCPLRIENVQYDAVLSLNDPSDASAQSIILIPIVGSSKSTPSAKLLDRISPRLPELLTKDTTTNVYTPVDVSTGADWALSSLIPTAGNRVQSGFYQWISGRGYESYDEMQAPSGFGGSWIRRTRWRPREPRQNYILIETPIEASSTTLATILSLPRTDPLKALPPVSPIVTYVPCAKTPPPPPVAPIKETFDPECDPFGPNAYQDTSAEKAKLLATIFGAIVAVIAVMAGVYAGLLFAGSNASIYTKELGETGGAWIYKQIQSAKAASGALKGNIIESIAKQAIR